jgi:hypothetical protein
VFDPCVIALAESVTRFVASVARTRPATQLASVLLAFPRADVGWVPVVFAIMIVGRAPTAVTTKPFVVT